MRNLTTLAILIFVLFFSSCNTEILTDFNDVVPTTASSPETFKLTEYRVEAGRHDFKPNPSPAPIKVSRIGFYSMFTEDTKYVLKGKDQLDYNKLAGGSFNFINHLVDAFMLGWRYNVEEDVFEVIDYWHKDKGRFIGADNSARPIMKVKAGETFAYWWELKSNSIIFHIKNKAGQELVRSMPFKKGNKTFKELSAWFGGTSPAPKALKLYTERVKIWVNNAPAL